MADTTWKAVERKIARLIGGKRTGNSGRNTEDVAHHMLSVEVKHRKQLPKWLLGAYQQACDNADEGKLPVVVLHQKHSRRYLAVLDLTHLINGNGSEG